MLYILDRITSLQESHQVDFHDQPALHRALLLFVILPATTVQALTDRFGLRQHLSHFNDVYGVIVI